MKWLQYIQIIQNEKKKIKVNMILHKVCLCAGTCVLNMESVQDFI